MRMCNSLSRPDKAAKSKRSVDDVSIFHFHSLGMGGKNHASMYYNV